MLKFSLSLFLSFVISLALLSVLTFGLVLPFLVSMFVGFGAMLGMPSFILYFAIAWFFWRKGVRKNYAYIIPGVILAFLNGMFYLVLLGAKLGSHQVALSIWGCFTVMGWLTASLHIEFLKFFDKEAVDKSTS